MPLQKTYKTYEGSGTTSLNGKSIEIYFKIEIDSSSDISGEIDFFSNVSLADVFKIIQKEDPFNILGNTKEGYIIEINKCVVYHSNHKMGGSKYEIKDILIKAMDFTVINKDIVSVNKIKYGILCLDIFRSFSFKYSGDILIFSPLPDSNEIIKTIKREKESMISAYIEVEKDLTKYNIKEKSIELCDKINMLLDLTSFAQGITQSVLSIEGLKEENFMYGYYRNVKTRRQGFTPIIFSPDLESFLMQVSPNYTDELNSNTGLNSSIEWYIESVGALLMESKFIFSFNYLERILYHHKKHRELDTILAEEDNAKFQKKLKASIKEILLELKIDSSKRSSIYSKTQELNRYTLWDSLQDFIKCYEIGYSDLFTDFGELKNIRDNIIHTGMPNTPFHELNVGVDKIIVFNQRIFLSLLKYEGNWINRLNKYHVEKFVSNPKSD